MCAYLNLGNVQIGPHMHPTAPVMVYAPAIGYVLHYRGSSAPSIIISPPLRKEYMASKPKVYAYVCGCIASALEGHEAVVFTPIGACEDWCMKAACRAACDAAIAKKKANPRNIILNIIGSSPDHSAQLVRRLKAVCRYMLTRVKQAGQKKILKAFLVRT